MLCKVYPPGGRVYQPNGYNRHFLRGYQRATIPWLLKVPGTLLCCSLEDDIDKVTLRLYQHEQRLQKFVTTEDYAAAANEKDRIMTLSLEKRKLEVKRQQNRREEVFHSIGMVVVHRRYAYRGVIFGYDTCCLAPEEWIQTMQVDKLPRGRHQPFYRILVDERDRPGGQITYVAQDNIVGMRRSKPLRHPLLTHYFVLYHEGYYVPNRFLRTLYPDDV